MPAAITAWPHLGAYGRLGVLLLFRRQLSGGHSGKHVPRRGKVVEDEPSRLQFDPCSDPGTLELSEKFRRIGKCPGTNARHWWLWSKAAGGLLEENYVSLFGTAPNGNEPSTGPKHAGNLAGSGRAINRVH